MGSSLRLGRVFGIEVGVNWSWLVVFALLVWTLATGIFPSTNPRLGDGTHLAMAVVATLLFFCSLLLHELGHAYEARREGMTIDGITLWLFGGVARFRGMFASAGAEFRIAVAGPLVSLVLGATFVLIALIPGLPQAVDGVVAWLGYINLLLLVFNLIPALPLDGGRVLRSILWKAKGEFVAATSIAAGIGRAFGYLFIVGGIAFFVFQGSFSGAWLAFIGWFLLGAATAEARAVLVRQALGGLRVRDLMTPDPVTVPPDLTLGEFMDDVVWDRRHTTYPVVENGRAAGLLPFRCVAAVPRPEWDERRVRDCMLGLDEVPVLAPGEHAAEALAELSESDVNRALVVSGDRLVGLLSIRDLARALETRPRRRRPGRRARPLSRVGGRG
ncbi:MAG TPA: site-2 protease family protein [Gaiellaceae bacterium]|jgi:Zn-dependent protease|nr:site-2 protease family protein [Gaiellaceae bacterium]